ncbi:hypothetical protein MHBO_004504, partial [Bonamia ostreae]
IFRHFCNYSVNFSSVIPLLNKVEEYPKDDQNSLNDWAKEFRQANLDKQKFRKSLLETKENIEKLLEALKEKKEEQIYFDIPFPVPDTTLPESERPKQKEMNAWSRERMELLQAIDENSAELGMQYQLTETLRQENGEIKLKLKLLANKVKAKSIKLSLYRKMEDSFSSALNSELVLPVEGESDGFKRIKDKKAIFMFFRHLKWSNC